MLEDFVKIEIQDELFITPDRILFWPARRTIILSDLHLGKATHFNRYGQALPNSGARKDMERLKLLCEVLEAETLLVTGDLFHSEYNNEFELIKELKQDFPDLRLQVVRGNHDILSREQYLSAGIDLFEKELQCGPFLFVHDPLEENTMPGFRIGGHVHPGVSLSGKGRQHLRLPCYFIDDDKMILPAFGSLTGLHTLRYSSPEEKIYAIAGEKLVLVPNTVKSEV